MEQNEQRIAEMLGAAFFAHDKSETPSAIPIGVSSDIPKARPRRFVVILLILLKLLLGTPGAIAAGGIGAVLLVRSFSATSSSLTVVTGRDLIGYQFPQQSVLTYSEPMLLATTPWTAMCVGEELVFQQHSHGATGLGGACPHGDSSKATAIVNKEIESLFPWGLGLTVLSTIWQAALAAMAETRRKTPEQAA
jgi:hypothetical protein